MTREQAETKLIAAAIVAAEYLQLDGNPLSELELRSLERLKQAAVDYKESKQ